MTAALSESQRELLEQLSKSELADQFYFSGGSALSAHYLGHRRSLDLDFFARHPFDPKRVVRFLNELAEGEIVPRRAQDRYEFTVPLRGERLRVEFVHYDFDQVADSGISYGALRVDSLRDLLANKLSAIIERVEGKDFVDIYFLLQRPELNLEQGIADCQAKFGWPGLRYLLQTALLRIERLEILPETTPPVSLDELRAYFRNCAASLIELDEPDS